MTPESRSAADRSTREHSGGDDALEIVREPEQERAAGARVRASLALARVALESTDPAAVLDAGAHTLAETLDADRVAILEVPATGAVAYRAGAGWPTELRHRSPIAGGPRTQVAYTLTADAPVLVRDTRDERRFDPGELAREQDLRSALSLPLRVGTEPFGVVLVHRFDPAAFDDRDAALAVAVTQVLEAALARQRADREQRDAAAAMGTALAGGQTGVWSWQPGSPSTEWSDTMQRLCGLAPGSFDGTMKSFLELVHPDDLPHVTDNVARLAGGERVAITGFRVVTPGGDVRWIESRGSPVDPSEPTGRWVGVCVDVTEYVNERERLFHALANLDTLLSHAPVGFAFLDTELRFVEVSERLAEMNGLPVGAHLGRSPGEIVPEVWAKVEPVVRGVLATGEPVVNVEVTGTSPAGPGVERSWLVSFYPVDGGDGRRLGVGSVVTEITERRRAERASQLVANVGPLFAAPIPRHELLERLARIPLPDFACGCVLNVAAGSGRRSEVAVAHLDAATEESLRDLFSKLGRGHDGDPPATTDLCTEGVSRFEKVGQAEIEALPQLPDVARFIEEFAIGSLLTAAMRIGQRVIGTITFFRSEASGVRYQAEDEQLASVLATRVARVIDNATVTAEAEKLRERLDGLARLGELVTVELESRARLATVARVIVPTFADVSAVYLADGEGRLALAAFAHVDPALEARVGELDRWPLLGEESRAPQLDAFRSNVPVLLPRVPWRHARRPAVDDEDARDLVYDMGVHSLLCVPLPGPQGPIGVLTLGYVEPDRVYGDDDIGVAREIARRVGPALDNAMRFEQEHALVEALQRSLLPERLPIVRGVELAARYLPGGAGLHIGGDWYEVFPLGDDRVLLAIGDVVGHGVRAAAAMGRVRSVLQFCAGRSTGPADVLSQLNEHLSSLADSDMATLLVMIYDQRTGRIELASAGHPPPLVRSPDGSVAFLSGGRGVPLCITGEPTYEQMEAHLEPGSMMLLYTDGLVERRGESLDAGLARLEAAWREAPEDLEHAAEHVIAQVLDEGPLHDDVALLVLRARERDGTMDLWLWAHPRELATLRAAVRDWVMERGGSRWEADEVSLAVNEAATNTIEHAYGSENREFVVSAVEHEGELQIRVRDFGRWREARPRSGPGWGLELARALMDTVEIASTPQGTEVHMVRRLRGPETDESAPADGADDGANGSATPS